MLMTQPIATVIQEGRIVTQKRWWANHRQKDWALSTSWFSVLPMCRFTNLSFDCRQLSPKCLVLDSISWAFFVAKKKLLCDFHDISLPVSPLILQRFRSILSMLKFSSYRAVNTVSVIKTSQLMLYREIICMFWDPYKIRKYTVWTERRICEC
jgi:hypothetical protein